MSIRRMIGALAVAWFAAPVDGRAAQPLRPLPVETVLFVCEHGTVRSLLAKVFFEQYARDAGLHMQAISRGTRADSAVPPWMLRGLAADHVTLGAWQPQTVRPADLAQAAYVVSFDVPREATAGARAPRAQWDSLPSVSTDYATGRDAIKVRVRILVDSLVRARNARTSCMATPTSLTPPGWKAPALPTDGPRGALRAMRDIPLPGPANRFDYQDVDPAAGRLYINHMNAGRVVVFDLDSSRVVSEITGADRATGIRSVPSLHTVYVSAAGRHEVLAIDTRTLQVVGRIGNIVFPDGIAYAPVEQKVFVSDERGDADVVIDARTNTRRSVIALGGEAGNTQYDSVSHCVLVAVQTRNQLVAIDPGTERIVARYDLDGSDHPHGFALDEPGRLAFISCEGNGKLLVVDLRTMKILETHTVPDDPDVLAWDAAWRRLYVAAESGALSSFWADGNALHPIGDLRIPHAHSVAVDPRTHLVYLPLENIGGRPVLRILEVAR